MYFMRGDRCWYIKLIIYTVFGVMFAQLISMLNTRLVGAAAVSKPNVKHVNFEQGMLFYCW